jgi:RimJ/RimL family protein N-acetyltransferase
VSSPPYLETPHLLFRAPTDADLGLWSRLFADTRLVAHIGGVRTAESCQESLAAIREHWARHGFGTCVVVDKASGAEIGLGGFKYHTIEGLEVVDIGGILERRFQGQGLALEGTQALIQHGFSHHHFTKITASITPGNRVAQILLRRLGFRFMREVPITYAGQSFPKVLYWELTAPG